MAIYPDKKDGRLTGRFRVELQRGKERYRKRWDNFSEAQADEAAVLSDWASGAVLPAPGRASGAPNVWSFDTVIPLARGDLWDGIDTEALCYTRLEKTADLMGRKTLLDDIKTRDVDALIKKLRAKGLADGTVNRYLAHLRKFLVWSEKREYRTVPVEKIEFAYREEPEGRIRWITPAEETVMGEYLLSRTDPRGVDNAQAVWKLIQVGIATGCRVSELISAEIGQLNGTRLHLWKTKTDTPRTIPMSAYIADLLRDLITSGTMPSYRTLRSWWMRLKDHMGLTDDADFVFHTCRHTCATRMVEAGINVFVIQRWMGHKRLETTLRYAHVKDENLEDALDKVGEMMVLVAEKARKTANSNDTLMPPTAGEIANLQAAA